MERRSFLKGLGIAGVLLAMAPASFAQPSSYTLYGDGVHDDTAAFQAWIEDKPVHWPNGRRVGSTVSHKCFRISHCLDLSKARSPKIITNNYFDTHRICLVL